MELGMKVHVGQICQGLELQRYCALGGVKISGQNRRHLHGDQTQGRPVVEKTVHRTSRSPTITLAAVQKQTGSSLRANVSSRTIEGTWLKNNWYRVAHYVNGQ
ncbi:hypothetical protein TNCV_4334191 [Trichonephila clavipes]|nr:hypothetical protein TNCV_4334191 [Trichonephila clavipes]